MKNILLILCLTGILSGCANMSGYVQMHKGAALPPTQKAMIQGSNNYRRGALANEMIRIVAVDGVEVPRQWGVGEGANSVSVLPGFHIVKVFYVHGSPNGIDYYIYDSVTVRAVANCTYQIVSYTDSKTNAMGFSFIGFPSSQSADTECGQGIVDMEKQKPVSI